MIYAETTTAMAASSNFLTFEAYVDTVGMYTHPFASDAMWASLRGKTKVAVTNALYAWMGPAASKLKLCDLLDDIDAPYTRIDRAFDGLSTQFPETQKDDADVQSWIVVRVDLLMTVLLQSKLGGPGPSILSYMSWVDQAFLKYRDYTEAFVERVHAKKKRLRELHDAYLVVQERFEAARVDSRVDDARQAAMNATAIKAELDVLVRST